MSDSNRVTSLARSLGLCSVDGHPAEKDGVGPLRAWRARRDPVASGMAKQAPARLAATSATVASEGRSAAAIWSPSWLWNQAWRPAGSAPEGPPAPSQPLRWLPQVPGPRHAAPVEAMPGPEREVHVPTMSFTASDTSGKARGARRPPAATCRTSRYPSAPGSRQDSICLQARSTIHSSGTPAAA